LGFPKAGYKYSQLLGRGQGPLSSYSTQQNAPKLSSYGILPSKGYRDAWEAEGEVLKSCFPKICPTQSLSKEKSSHRLRIFPRKPLLCPSKEGECREREKERSWEKARELTKEGIKKKGDWGLSSSFGVPLVCRERFLQGPGLGLRSPWAQNPSCSSLGIGTGRRVQSARLCWAIPPGFEQPTPTGSPHALPTTATRVSF
jgi:hypothetical protein